MSFADEESYPLSPSPFSRTPKGSMKVASKTKETSSSKKALSKASPSRKEIKGKVDLSSSPSLDSVLTATPTPPKKSSSKAKELKKDKPVVEEKELSSPLESSFKEKENVRTSLLDSLPTEAGPLSSPSQIVEKLAPVVTSTIIASKNSSPDSPVNSKSSLRRSSTTGAKTSARADFKASEFIVYPTHGVGQIMAIEEQEVAGFKLELFVISFIKDKMIVKVPLPKVLTGAIRKLSEPLKIKKALEVLAGRARIKRTMWSRRAQEYEIKINSGDLIAIAEVVRDLYRSDSQPEQSYSERQLYEAAFDRMVREVAMVEKVSEPEAVKLMETYLQKSPPRRLSKALASSTEAEAEPLGLDADIEEAA